MKKIFIILACSLPLIVSGTVPHADSSVLAGGRWYKLAVTHTGIHRITYQDLAALGIDPSAIDVSRIRLFGNGSGMLPESNAAARTDDLREIAIQVADGGDGHLDASGYILFYGESPDKWNYDKTGHTFLHQRNLYSDSTYYFLNFDQGTGKRVQLSPVVPAAANNFSYSFDDFLFHELDSQNLIRSGREWYGETFDNLKSSREFPFIFPDIDTLATVKVNWYVAANSPLSSYFYLSQAGKVVDSLKIEPINPTEFTRAGRSKAKSTLISNPAGDQTLTLSYNMPTSNSKGWLNYLEVNCRRNLVWTGPQMNFRDVLTVGTGRITEFTMKAAGPSIRIWDVSDPARILEIPTLLSGNLMTFKRKNDTLREFTAFDGSFFYPVTLCGEIQKQDLHAAGPTTLVIVSNPLFITEAEQLGTFHREHNGLTVQVVSTAQVYNEFSCGQPDPTAIRDFLKMLFDRGTPSYRPKYVLLFGDGSYDPKNRIPGNNNLVPTYQSTESLNSTTTYVTDDYYGIMGDNSGSDSNGPIDLGVGRFPVSTSADAQVMVNKILSYSSLAQPVRSDWRNIITFVADDENANLHLHQAEEMCSIVAGKYPVFNVNKIYFDAYKLVEIPGGSRFPDANRALNDAVAKGSLIVNYTGHGGETGWSYEQVLTTTDILSWKNRDMLPVFVTATCEFSRFDNPERFTAGEMLILQPEGGAIALYSTTRLAFAGLNILLNTSFFKHLMDKDANGKYIKMGDLIRLSKNDNHNNFQLRNFVLLGDPAQGIAFPGYNVRTLSINGHPASQPDTVKGMSAVTVIGQIEDASGNKVSTFNGVMNCKVYDKPVTNTTLGNRPNGETYPENFNLQNSLLFRGDVPVQSGEFRCTFVLPRSIALQFGKGKLSYYACSDSVEASGYSDQIVIGGRDESVNPVNPGPEIGLYLDTRDFLDGGITGAAPLLLVDLYDTNGINSLGLGIGHEIEAILDDDRAGAIVLNDFYSPVYNSFTRGTIAYPLSDLSPGLHTISVKAWDMYDNSSVKEIGFYVTGHPRYPVRSVMNVPNPMADNTRFVFTSEDTSPGGLEVIIRIYNLRGAQVCTLESDYPDPLAGSSQITWDGTDSSGKKLSSGIYPYKVIFKAKNGAYTETSQKLMITR